MNQFSGYVFSPPKAADPCLSRDCSGGLAPILLVRPEERSSSHVERPSSE